jgi:hypothetical protein
MRVEGWGGVVKRGRDGGRGDCVWGVTVACACVTQALAYMLYSGCKPGVCKRMCVQVWQDIVHAAPVLNVDVAVLAWGCVGWGVL